MFENIEKKEKNDSEPKETCCICGEYHEIEEIHELEVKDQKKYICKGCADTVHGLI